ncbi:hypothetical protein LXL04_027260 [Taraxacum kok-saghyz]
MHTKTFAKTKKNKERRTVEALSTMASMNFTSFNISKASISPPMHSLSFPQKASRICFTTPFKQYSQRIRASDGKSLSEMGGYAVDKLKEDLDGINKAAGEMKDGSLDNLTEANERMKENVAEMKENVSNMAGKADDLVKEKSQELNESA